MGCCFCKENIDFNSEVDLSHFTLLRAVGKGAFGKVRVVEHRRTKQVYALKYINKAKCVSMRAVENTISERRLLEEIQSPFVCNLKYAFQDNENLFMVLDLMLGGDLRFHIDRCVHFEEKRIQFYAAELGLSLKHLHEKNVVHRDIKPDNILLDQFGHAHLTDFNVAVKYNPEKPMNAIAGSLAYMAPEILRKKGYTSDVDWWSLGIVLYEFQYGKRPLKGKSNEQLAHAILHDHIHFSSTIDNGVAINPQSIDLISGLLNRDVKKRLGGRENGGFEGFMSHPFFADMDWSNLEKKLVTPPFIPDPKKLNFDATHELEELLLEDNPLTAQSKMSSGEGRTMANGEPIPKEYLLLEEKFKVFDFTKPKAEVSSNELVLGKRMSIMKKGSILMKKGSIISPPLGLIKLEGEIESHHDVMEGRDEEVLGEINEILENFVEKKDAEKTKSSEDKNIEDHKYPDAQEEHASDQKSPETEILEK